MRLITGDECGLLKECIPELSTNAEDEEKNEAVSVPSRRRVLISKDKGVELLNPDFLASAQNGSGINGGLRRKGAVSLTWMSTRDDDSQFASLHVDGTVQLWKASSTASSASSEMNTTSFEFARYRRVSEISNIFQTTTPTPSSSVEKNADDAETANTTTMVDPFSKPIVLYAFETSGGGSSSNSSSSSDYTSQRLVACNAQGTVCILNPSNKSYSNRNINDADSLSPIVKTFETVTGNQNMTSTPTTKNIARLQYPNITATALDTASSSSSTATTTPTRIALGGRDRDVMIWDLESSQQVYKAKNLPPDPQTLLQPLVWPTCMTFVQHTSAFDGNPHILAVGTAYCQVRVYDVRVQQAVMGKNVKKSAPMKQRPLAFSPIKDCPHLPLEHRVTALLPMANDSCQLVVGDAAGYLQTMDMRLLEKNTSHTSKSSIHGQQYGQAQPSCMVGRFVGPGGSVRGLAQDASGSMLAAVGLDRMLRLYDTNTRKQVYCMYLKQRLNCVLFGREQVNKKKRCSNKGSHDNENDDDDDTDDNKAGSGDEDDYDSADMDADDVVEDYVDSSDEEGDDGNGAKVKLNIAQEGKRSNAQDDKQNDDNAAHDDDSSYSSDDSSDEEDDDDDNDEAPHKKARR